MIYFLILISIIVFIHELGHYFVAKQCGVKIDAFSIGFGKEIFGFNDKHGTRWKFCILPLGGYVKMHGDDNATSASIAKNVNINPKYSFFHKTPLQKIYISVAGPLFNYILSFIVFAFISYSFGITKTSTIISDVKINSPAAKAGFLPDDNILKINDKEVEDFNDIKAMVMISLGQEMNFTVKRNRDLLNLTVKPVIELIEDKISGTIESYSIGIISQKPERTKLNFFQSMKHGIKQIYTNTTLTLKALGQMVTGKRSSKELGGPIKIAKYSSMAAKTGLASFLHIIAIISLNLGLMNLFPIPGLDGGHILINIVELIYGKKLNDRIINLINYIGFGLIGMLMIVAFYNDILSLFR